MEYTQRDIGWTCWDATNGDYRIRISELGGYNVTIMGDTLNGRVVRNDFATLDAAQEWVVKFLDIAATTPIAQSRYFIPLDPMSSYSEEGKGQMVPDNDDERQQARADSARRVWWADHLDDH